MTNNTLSRRRYHLRTNRHAQIRLPTKQKAVAQENTTHIVQMLATATPKIA